MRDDDDRLVSAALDKKKKRLRGCHKDVMGNEPSLPSFGLEPLPKLLLNMEELFLAYAEDIDFVEVWRQKKEVTWPCIIRRCPS